MIAHLDNLLRHLFVTRVAALTTANQVGFQPPNADWITFVKGLGEIALNVYLVGFTENLELRSNERIREIQNGVVQETRAPRRLDCHYLITAWSPSDPLPPLVEPTLEEHDLLFAVATVLADAEPMVPRLIYAPAPLPLGFPEAIADAELPSELLPFEGFPPTPDFWSTMEGPWKPGLQLTVTLPLLFTKQVAGPMVITRITEYRQIGGVGAAEVFIQIGGHVLKGATPVPGAWVRLETPGALPLQTAETDSDGRFTFVQLAAGSYVLRVRATGSAEVTRNITVPAATGGYDVQI